MAACLLMPARSFRAKYKAMKKGKSQEELIASLQACFCTSYESVERRILEVCRWMVNLHTIQIIFSMNCLLRFLFMICPFIQLPWGRYTRECWDLPFHSPTRWEVLRGQRQRDSSLWTPILRCGGEWVRQLSLLRLALPARTTAGRVGEYGKSLHSRV